MKQKAKWLFALIAAIAAYYWKILFTRQFTIMWQFDDANLGFEWYNFIVRNLKAGALPLWDAYTHAGHLFQAEFQTGAFYPLTWLLALAPTARTGLLSINAYYDSFILAHVLAGSFMFLLAEELGLAGFSALLSAVCFTFSSTLLPAGWPNFVNSSVWLPLIVLFLIRALKRGRSSHGLLYSCAAGLSLGMAVLAGGLHIVIMEGLVVVSVAAYSLWRRGEFGQEPMARAIRWHVTVVAVVVVVAGAAGAVQLLPAWQYGKLALRFLGGDSAPSTAVQKIPYTDLTDHFSPNGVVELIFRGAPGYSGEIRPYIGLFPLLLVIIGIWRNWAEPWVRYLSGLGLLSFLYSLGHFSLLHGLGYALVPFLWMAREPGRFLFITQFALAVLAGYGVQTLLNASRTHELTPLVRILKWVAVASGVLLIGAILSRTTQWDEWMSLSCIFVWLTAGLFAYIVSGHRTRAVQFLLLAFVVSDLQTFDWSFQAKTEMQKGDRDELENVYKARGMADFLKSRPGQFRVQVLAAGAPSIGPLYGVYTTDGFTASVTKDFYSWWELRRAGDLLNVRYVIKPSSSPDAGFLYQDSRYKVYENPSALPRAWIVHEAIHEPSRDAILKKENAAGFEPLKTAFVESPLEAQLDPPAGGSDSVAFDECCEGRLVLTAHAQSRALLVLSEAYFSSWQATVNGAPAPVHKVDGLLRGVVIPPGTSRIVFNYRPVLVYVGLALSLAAFFGVFVFALALHLKGRAANRAAA